MQLGEISVQAVVRALEGQDALVEVAHGGCGRCHEKGGCGGQNLTQAFCSSPKSYRVANDLRVGVGDHVNIAVAQGSVRQVANLAYGLPLLGLIGGALGGGGLAGEPGSILGGILGLAGTFGYLRLRFGHRVAAELARPRMVGKVHD